MVDLHHHLLPALDDGSPDLATSVAMARMAAEDGITHVVCTPHASGHWEFSHEAVEAKLAELRGALTSEGISLTLGAGCDFHLSYDNVQDAIANPTKYTINHNGYLLVELPDYGLSPNLAETFYALQLAGMTPILTHPERNPTLQKNPERLNDWIRNGLLLQVTTSSVLGKMGKPAEKMANKLLADRWVHFLSTDAHNLDTRPPNMHEAYELVGKKFGSEYARLLCVTNPLAVFEGRGLPEQMEPLGLYDGDVTNDHVPWRRWLKKLVGW